MSGDFATTLEQCLSQVESARARVQSCLVSYPTLAGELEPLLRTAEVLRTAPRPDLSPEAEARISTLVFGAVNPAPVARHRAQGHRRPRLVRSWALAGMAALLLVALLGTAGLAFGATDALPGSALYPVKRAVEAAWLWATPQGGEAALHLRLAERRLAETEDLARHGLVDPGVLQAMAGDVEATLASTESMIPETALPLLEAVVDFSGQEEQTLARLLGQVPAGERVHFQQALQICREQGRRARGAVDARKQGHVPPGQERQPPGQVATPPGQDVRPDGLNPPPGQEKVPPGQQQVPPGQVPGDPADPGDKEEEKEAAKDEKEEEKEAAAEEREEEKEAAAEEKEEEKEAAEDEKEEEKEAAEEEKEAAEEEKEDEKEEDQEEKEDEKEGIEQEVDDKEKEDKDK